MSNLDPSVVASIDQTRALLRDLTDDARRHHAEGCDDPSACIGYEALRRVYRHRDQVGQILALAIAERAQRMADDA